MILEAPFPVGTQGRVFFAWGVGIGMEIPPVGFADIPPLQGGRGRRGEEDRECGDEIWRRGGNLPPAAG